MWFVELCKFAASGIIPCAVTVVMIILLVIVPSSILAATLKELVAILLGKPSHLKISKVNYSMHLPDSQNTY